MRVLQIINDLRVGGAETLCCQLTVGLQHAGVDARTVVLAETTSFLADELAEAGAPEMVSASSTPPLSVRSIRQISALQRRMTGFDIVHVHLFPAQLWAAIALTLIPKARRPVLVTTEHNTHNRRRNTLFRPIDRFVYKRYERIVAISEATAESLSRWIPSVEDRIVVIPNGIDYERFAEARAATRASFLPNGVPYDAPMILCVGRLETQKDQGTLVRALRSIPRAHLCLVGTGEMQDWLEALAAAQGVRDRVHFLGRRSDVPELLKAATVYVQPSLWEGFGIAVAEAMAAGVPAVVSDVAGVREVIGDTGLLFQAGDEKDLAAQVNRLLNDAIAAGDFAARARGRARQFSIDRFIESHVELYESLMVNK